MRNDHHTSDVRESITSLNRKALSKETASMLAGIILAVWAIGVGFIICDAWVLRHRIKKIGAQVHCMHEMLHNVLDQPTHEDWDTDEDVDYARRN